LLASFESVNGESNEGGKPDVTAKGAKPDVTAKFWHCPFCPYRLDKRDSIAQNHCHIQETWSLSLAFTTGQSIKKGSKALLMQERR